MTNMSYYLPRPHRIILHAKPLPSRRILAVQSLWQRGSIAQLNDPAEEPPLVDPPVPNPGHDPDETPPTYDVLMDSAPHIEQTAGGKI